MAEGKKHVVFVPEVYEMLLVKAEKPVNPIASTIKQTQENLWNRGRFLKKKIFDCIQKI